MACVLKFVRLDDFIADIDEVDLMAGGYELAKDGYLPTAAPDGAKSVFESITLKITGTSKDDLADKVQAIDEKIKQIGWWIKNPGVEKYQVWLRTQLSNESLPRQAQILSVKPPEKLPIYNPAEINANYIGEYTLGIERTPFWEDSYPYPTTTTKSSIAAVGGKVQLSETIYGDVPARLPRLILSNSDPGEKLIKAWLGFKTSRFGNPANFEPVWDIWKGAYDNVSDTVMTADANAHGGFKIVTSFTAGATLLERANVTVQDIASSNPDDQRGTYLVLMRAKMSDTSVARARIGYGFAPVATIGNSPIYRSRVVISGTSWQTYEMGIISIPASLILPADQGLLGSVITLEVERLSGAGNFETDCFILIPQEAAITVSTPYTTNNGDYLKIYQKADGRIVAYSTAFGTYIQAAYLIQPIDWGLPANSEKPYLVVCENSTSSATHFTVTVSYDYISRFRTLRGNVT